MGTGSSKRTFGLSKEDHLLYSPALLDLEHGTIRHRDKELVEANEAKEVRQGYFYHAQLTDWSDDTCIKDFQKMHVVEASKREADKKVFYVYAKGLESEVEDPGLRKTKPKPKGLGYRWRGDSEHRYFRLRFSKRRDEEGSESETEELHGFDTVFRIHPKDQMTVFNISEILSLKLLIPVHRIHVIHKLTKLEPETIIQDLNPYVNRSKLELKILTDVEVVKYEYDKDEPPPENMKNVLQDQSRDQYEIPHDQDKLSRDQDEKPSDQGEIPRDNDVDRNCEAEKDVLSVADSSKILSDGKASDAVRISDNSFTKLEQETVRKVSTESAPIRRVSTESAPIRRLSTESAPIRRVSTESAPIRRDSVLLPGSVVVSDDEEGSNETKIDKYDEMKDHDKLLRDGKVDDP